MIVKPADLAYRIFQVLTVVLLGCGFVMVKVWPGVYVLLGMILYWVVTRRLRNRLYSWIALVMFTSLAAFGLISGVMPFLMIAGVSTALACLELEDHLVKSIRLPNASHTLSFEKRYLSTLVAVIAAGTIVAEAALFLRFSLPFGVIFLVVILVLFGIYQLFTLLKRVES